MLIGSALVFVTATSAGAWRVEKSWQDAPTTELVSQLRRKFLSPRFRVQDLGIADDPAFMLKQAAR